MRLSVDKKDKGYRFDLAKNKCAVYFNDEVRKDVITADEELGMIIAYVKDSKGVPKVNDERTAFVTQTLRGRVRIDIQDDKGQSLKDPKVKAEWADEGVMILVYSKMQPGNIRRSLVDRRMFPNEQTMLVGCEAAAGAAAEYCCNMHGDVFDPKDVAEAGLEVARELLASPILALRH